MESEKRKITKKRKDDEITKNKETFPMILPIAFLSTALYSATNFVTAVGKLNDANIMIIPPRYRRMDSIPKFLGPRSLATIIALIVSNKLTSSVDVNM